jgi:pilus assembly protein Flp/PilA
MRLLKQLLNDSTGASAAEYALLLGIIGAAIGVAALALGGSISNAMIRTSNTINTCGGGC